MLRNFRGWRPRIAALVVVAIGLLITPVIQADRGVGIDAPVMEVATRLAPGGGYHLPRIRVINTGDEADGYEMSIGYLADQKERRPASGWFSFQPDRFELNAGETQDVIVGINVPRGAAPGDYFALVKAQTVSRQPGRTSVGVAAATKLSFTVEPSSWLDAQRRAINEALDDAVPWIYILPAGALLAILAVKARKLPFRVRIERR